MIERYIPQWVKQRFCEHDWELCRKDEPFASLRGMQLYKRCTKCKKVELDVYVEYEGAGYK